LALAAFNDPGAGGPGLYAAGTFQSADGVLAMNIARWDGTAWSPLGQGIGNSSSAVWRLEVYDDGNGPALYAMGSFFEAGGQPVAKLVRWKDSVWSEVGGGIQPANGIPYTSTRFGPPGEVPALWIGGNFGAGGTTPSANVAAWRGCPPCPANCDRSTIPPILNVNDFQCFLNRFASGDPSANCDGSTIPPVLNVNDFQCFLNLFAAGCP
jgi:hypothetical protein